MFNAKYFKEILKYISDDIIIDDDFFREAKELEAKGFSSELIGPALRAKYS